MQKGQKYQPTKRAFNKFIALENVLALKNSLRNRANQGEQSQNTITENP